MGVKTGVSEYRSGHHKTELNTLRHAILSYEQHESH